jgi:hypothetical protein
MAKLLSGKNPLEPGRVCRVARMRLFRVYQRPGRKGSRRRAGKQINYCAGGLRLQIEEISESPGDCFKCLGVYATHALADSLYRGTVTALSIITWEIFRSWLVSLGFKVMRYRGAWMKWLEIGSTATEAGTPKAYD